MKKPLAKSKPPALKGAVHVSDLEEPLNVVVYGRSGSGKTTFAASFPSPILVLDVRDRGTASVSDKDVTVKPIHNLDDLEDAYWYLKEYPDVYKTVVIDTLSQLQQVLTEEVLRGKGKNGQAVPGWGSMSRRQFGDLSALAKEWFLNFRNLMDLGIETVFIAQERTTRTEEDDTNDNSLAPEVGPALMPSLAMFVNANASAIVHTFIKLKRTKVKVGDKTKERQNVVYAMRVGPDPIYVTKLRKPSGIEAPRDIENANYEELRKAIRGE